MQAEYDFYASGWYQVNAQKWYKNLTEINNKELWDLLYMIDNGWIPLSDRYNETTTWKERIEQIEKEAKKRGITLC